MRKSTHTILNGACTLFAAGTGVIAGFTALGGFNSLGITSSVFIALSGAAWAATGIQILALALQIG